MNRTSGDSVRFVVALITTLLLTLSAIAQDPPPDPEPTPEPPAEEQPEADDETSESETADDETDEAAEEESEEPEDRVLAIVGGTVHTVSGSVRRNATVLSRDGKITEIGRRVEIPDHAVVIDATGHHVYPGLVALKSGGLIGSEPADATNPYGLSMSLGLAAGITTAVSGTNAAKLSFGTLEDHELATGVFERLRYSTAQPQSRRRVRRALEGVRDYLRELARYEAIKEEDEQAEAPDDSAIKGANATYYRLIKGEATALTSADTADDIIAVVELAREFGFRLVIDGAREGWAVADRIGIGDVAAIVTPRERGDHDDRFNRPNGPSIENAATLLAGGVAIGVMPPGSGISLGGLAGRDLLNLNLEAAFAVRGGLTTAQAVRTITLDAARILGQDHRIGSIEIGKDADFVIADGPILDYQTLARYTIVNGRIAYDRDEEPLLSHIRPDGNRDGGDPPPNDYWPRRLGDPQQFP